MDEELRQHHSDLLFRIHLEDSLDAYAYVLVEHKSSPDPAARLQLLRYLVCVLVDWFDRNQRQLPLPPVLPLLAHQGPQGWKLSCEFAELFGPVPETLSRYLPSFRHALVDLTLIDDDSLILHETLERLVPNRKERIMGWLTQPYYEKGKAEGRAEGRSEGKVEGEATLLERLLERRFGELPPSLRERILAADATAIESWAERFLNATDLHSIFETN